MKFVIQTDHQLVRTELGLAVLEAADVLDFLQHTPITFRLQETTEPIASDEVPVGTVEWVEAVSGIQLTPINLPACFCSSVFCHHAYSWQTRKELKKTLKSGIEQFIKSGTRVKPWIPVITNSIEDVPEDTKYFVSDLMDIRAEYRAFVSDGKLLDVKQYIGDWDTLLTESNIHEIHFKINHMRLPRACTVDFAKTDRGMELLEIHNFISCGLYGFDDPVMVARMAYRAWQEEKNHSYKLGTK